MRFILKSTYLRFLSIIYVIFVHLFFFFLVGKTGINNKGFFLQDSAAAGRSRCVVFIVFILFFLLRLLLVCLIEEEMQPPHPSSHSLRAIWDINRKSCPQDRGKSRPSICVGVEVFGEERRGATTAH